LENSYWCRVLENWFYNVYFITLLAFDDKTIISNAKFIILLSLIAGIIGFVFLKTLKVGVSENNIK
jgi:NhaA family Na+:H+ antiporter